VVAVRLRAGPAWDDLVPDEDAEAFEPLEMPADAAGEAELALARGDVDAALEVAESLAGRGVKHGSEQDAVLARAVAARAHLMSGNLDSARTVLGELRGDDRVAVPDAALCLGEGDLDGARDRATRALALAPRGMAEHYTMALLYASEGAGEQAMATLALVARSLPEHAVARHQLAHLTALTGDPARAGTLWEAATELAPRFLPPALALAKMMANSRQYAEAIKILGEVSERVPEKISPRLMHLRILLDMGQADSAVELGRLLKEAAPDSAEAQLMWAEALILAEQGPVATRELDAFLAQHPGVETTKVYQLLGRAELAHRPPRVSRAITRLEQALETSPDSADILLELAEVYVKTGRGEDATPWLDRLAASDQVDFGTLLYAAVMSRDQQMWSMARRLAEAARDRVAGTAVEGQVTAFLAALPEGL
jgi:predicted Zn-dependent protease